MELSLGPGTQGYPFIHGRARPGAIGPAFVFLVMRDGDVNTGDVRARAAELVGIMLSHVRRVRFDDRFAGFAGPAVATETSSGSALTARFLAGWPRFFAGTSAAPGSDLIVTGLVHLAFGLGMAFD